MSEFHYDTTNEDGSPRQTFLRACFLILGYVQASILSTPRIRVARDLDIGPDFLIAVQKRRHV